MGTIKSCVTSVIIRDILSYSKQHCKYNAIERCWGRLEEHWNGEILDSIKKAVEWSKTMTWKGIKPIVHLCQKVYEKGVTLTHKEKMGSWGFWRGKWSKPSPNHTQQHYDY